MKIVILKAFPRLARIIKTRDDAISENALLKLRIMELERRVEGVSNIDKKTALNHVFLKDCSEDFSVTIFDKRDIPGRKGG